MAYEFKELNEKAEEAQEWLKGELLTIQTGRANAAALDGILVESYGAKVPLQQVSTVTNEDARTLRLVPYNPDDIVSIEKALEEVDLGFGVGSDDKGVRVKFPELTTETREKYVRLVHKKLEATRISLRGVRDDVWNDIQKMERSGEFSKDQKFRLKDEMEDIVKKANDQLQELADRKEQEVSG